MAEENQNISHGYQPAAPASHEEESEIKDRGLFDFLGKKKEEEEVVVPTAAAHHQNVVIATELEHVHVSDDQCKDHHHHQETETEVVVHEVEKEDEKKHHSSLLEKLHRSDSSSSSSSDEEVEENGEKIRRKKKKGLKERVHEHISGDTKVEEPEKKIDYYHEDTTVPIEKCDDVVVTHEGVVPHPEEKKGFLEKIKEKLPGGHKKPEEDHEGITHPVVTPPVDHHGYTSSTTDAAHHDGEETKEKKGFLEKIKEKLPGYHKSEDEEKKETTTHY